MTTHLKIMIHDTIDEFNQSAAAQFAEIVNQAIKARGLAFVALSGGGTPLGVYRLLAAEPYRSSVDWTAVQFYWGDERCVPPQDPESNYAQAAAALFAKLPVPAANIHRIQGELGGAAAAAAYIEVLCRNGQVGLSWPVLDVALMGMGEDGHTASLFPGKFIPAAYGPAAICATADYQGRPAERVSLTPPVFNTARNVMFLVTGEKKAPVLAKVLAGDEKFPAALIRPAEGNLIWHVDRAAAGELS